MDTIKSNLEISEIFSSGKHISSEYISFIIKQFNDQHDHQGRVAFIAGKKLGNAVWRNKAKRRMREICRFLNGPWDGFDVLFIAKPSLFHASYSKVLSTCEKTLKKNGLRSRDITDGAL